MSSKKVINYIEHGSYLENSDETQATINNLIAAIDPFLHKFNKNEKFLMLDVGCGDGTFTFSLINEIAKIVPEFGLLSIEPEAPAYKKFAEKAQKSNIRCIKHENATIQQFLKDNLDQQEIFDLIMFSQSFYHLPMEEWGFIIGQSDRLLKNGGLAAIILDSYGGEAYKLKDTITEGKAVTLEFGDFYSAEDIEKFLKMKNVVFKSSSFPVQLFVKDDDKKLENFSRQLAFLYRTYPELILPKYKEDVSGLLEKNKKDEKYYIENLVKIVTFHKL